MQHQVWVQRSSLKRVAEQRGDRAYEVITVTTEAGDTKTYYFNVTGSVH